MTAAYEVLDPRPTAAVAPYTFFLPHWEEIKAVGIGDQVKAVVRPCPQSSTYDAERLWLEVKSADDLWLTAELQSTPLDMPNLPNGSIIRLPRSFIVDVIINDPDRAATVSSIQKPRTYWQRCLVDQSILDGDLAVEYLYREAPDMAKGGDEFPDSGWRIRGDTRGSLLAQIGSRKVAYVALGAVLNKDDTWLHLIDEPVGSRFEMDYATGRFMNIG